MIYRKTRLLIAIMLLSGSCKKHLNQPANTTNNDPQLTVNKTLAQLNQVVPATGNRLISDDIVISGIVVANDRSGNLYKQVIIDDGTAGMAILVDAYNLYADFPVGRKLYIKCKGLYLGSYYKLPQLGYIPGSQSGLSPIPLSLCDNYIVKGNSGNAVTALDVNMADASKYQPELLNRLIRIKDVQVKDTLSDSIFALSPLIASATNIKVQDCNEHSLTIRTSGYCSFRALAVPKGKGTLIGIYTVYNNTPQLIIRDTSDIKLYGVRCQ